MYLICSFQDVITYDIPGDENSNKGAKFFFVTPDTGEIHLKNDLQADEGRDAQYRVSTITTNIYNVHQNDMHFSLETTPEIKRSTSVKKDSCNC